MSQQNVEIVRRAFEEWDGGGAAAVMPFLDSAAEMQLAPTILDEGVICGRGAIAAYLTSVLEHLWDAFAIEGTNFESVANAM